MPRLVAKEIRLLLWRATCRVTIGAVCAGVRFWTEQNDREDQRYDRGSRHRGVSAFPAHSSCRTFAIQRAPPHLPVNARYMPPEVMGQFREDDPNVEQPQQARNAWHHRPLQQTRTSQSRARAHQVQLDGTKCDVFSFAVLAL